MISAIVFVSDAKRRDATRDRELLVRSLVWLVSAVVSGIVHDVTLSGPDALGLADIADQSGCNIATGASEADRLTAAVALGKYPRLLIVESGFHPQDSIIGELESLGRTLAPATAARLVAAPATLVQRLFPDTAPTVGLLAPAMRCRALPGRDFRRLEAALKPGVVFATRSNRIV